MGSTMYEPRDDWMRRDDERVMMSGIFIHMHVALVACNYTNFHVQINMLLWLAGYPFLIGG